MRAATAGRRKKEEHSSSPFRNASESPAQSGEPEHVRRRAGNAEIYARVELQVRALQDLDAAAQPRDLGGIRAQLEKAIALGHRRAVLVTLLQGNRARKAARTKRQGMRERHE